MPSRSEIEAVWSKGQPIRGLKPDSYRKDAHGNKVRRASYGKITGMGWEIDHIKPVSKGGSESMSNKRPLLTAANRRKSDLHPHKNPGKHR